MQRPSWDEVWMSMADDVAKRSLCVRSQVGCVVVSPRNQCVSVGYNGPAAGHDRGGYSGTIQEDTPCSGWCERATEGGAHAFYDNCVSIHAEMNALITGDRTAWEGGTLYVTRMPCFTCAKVISNSGIKRVVYRIAPEDWDRAPEKSEDYMHRSGLNVVWMEKKDG